MEQDWLHEIARSLEMDFPETRGQASYLAEKLAALILLRLPAESARRLMDLLPPHARDRHPEMRTCADSEADRSVGYASLVEKASITLSFHEGLPEESLDEYARQMTDFFLQQLAFSLPSEFHDDLRRSLPADLKQRMVLRRVA